MAGTIYKKWINKSVKQKSKAELLEIIESTSEWNDKNFSKSLLVSSLSFTVCKQNHYIANCSNFQNLSVYNIYRKSKRLQLGLNCLKVKIASLVTVKNAISDITLNYIMKKEFRLKVPLKMWTLFKPLKIKQKMWVWEYAANMDFSKYFRKTISCLVVIVYPVKPYIFPIWIYLII